MKKHIPKDGSYPGLTPEERTQIERVLRGLRGDRAAAQNGGERVVQEISPKTEDLILKSWEEAKEPSNRFGPFTTAEALLHHLHTSAATDG